VARSFGIRFMACIDRGSIDGCRLPLKHWLICKATFCCRIRTWLGFPEETSQRPDQRTESPWNGRMTGFASILTSLSRSGDMGVVPKYTRRRYARNTPQLSRQRRFSANPVSLLRHQFLSAPPQLCQPPRRRSPPLQQDVRHSPHKSSALAPLLKKNCQCPPFSSYMKTTLPSSERSLAH
jgi:hypothetical protein